MSFLWPRLLWLLLALPMLAAAYLWLLHRKKQHGVRYTNLAIVREAMGTGQTLRRHAPPLLFLAAMALLIIAAARPAAVVTLPANGQTIILAIDVSGSMRATDVQPTRLAAAQAAAKNFIRNLPRGVKVGIVSFAASAQAAQLPTTNRDDLAAAIDTFRLQRGTATGSGLAMSLAMLFPHEDVGFSEFGPPPGPRGMPIDPPGRQNKEPRAFTPVAPGSYTSAAIIMLTDGQRTTGIDPLEAAKMAAERGVRVYTVGIGTVEGDTIGFEGWSMRVRLDENALRAIAEETQAEYFYASAAQDLQKVYDTLGSRLTVERKETEISALFALAAGVLALLAALLSLLWFQRIL